MAASEVATRRVPLSAIILWTLSLLTFLIIFAMPSRAQTADLVFAPVDPASRVVLRGQRAPWALPQNSQGSVPGHTMLQHLTLVLKRSPQQQRVFEQFLQQQQDPASPNYHRWLTPIQIGKRFGASQHDIEAISEWLRAQGLRVDSVANSRMMIDFSGTASLVGAAFATEMRYYLVADEQRMATADAPQIPAALAGVIQSVSGLYTIKNRPFHGAGQAQVPAKGAGSASPAASFNCNGSSCNYYIFPADFATIYDLNSVYGQGIYGTGQTIAIIGRARVYTSDVENFESLSGLALKDPTVIVPPAGVDPGSPAGTGGATEDQLEATLDVLRATSVAPGASIDLIVSTSNGGQDGIAIAAQYAVDTIPVPAYIVNISFGACEAHAGLSGVQFWDSLFSQAAGEGISVFVASGDAGVAGCDTYFQTPPPTQTASPNYICSSSYSTCVGGTEFADAANPATYWSSTNGSGHESALSYIPEGGWNEPLSGPNTQAAASGGGVSAFIATPSWQTGTGVPGTQGRYTPDLAFSSSAHDGYFGCLAADGATCVVTNGHFNFEYFFGTSAAAPDMAGITALLNQKFQSAQGELNQRLYQLAATPANAVFHDVTVASSAVSGCAVTTPSMCNNSTPSPTGLTGGLSGYLVTTGFDEVTGLGSIDVANLLANWPAPVSTTTALTSSASSIPSGASVTFTATVTGVGPTGTVTFYNGTQIAANILGTGTLSSGVATLSTSSLVTVGSDSISAVYAGDANNLGSISQTLTETVSAATFTITAAPATQTISSGGTATISVTITPQGNYTSPIGFTATLTPTSTAQVSFNPATITPSSGVTATTLTIQGATSGPLSAAKGGGLKSSALNASALWAPITLAGILMLGRRKKSDGRVVRHFLLAATLGLIALTTFSCGGGGSSPHFPQTYQVQIAATAAASPDGNSGAVTTSKTVSFTAQ